MQELWNCSLAEHRRALDAGEYSARELLGAYLARIDAVDKSIGAFLTLDREGAMQAATRAEERISRGQALHLLDGIPFGVKDNLCTRGLRTTCGSRMLADYVPPYDATVVNRLRALGGVLLGKLNMDEFGMGSSTEHSAFGITKNPHDTSRVPGGSSGGSAAAVAAGEIPYALASDTGGSVRQPAAFCGIVGLKPTYGALSRNGLISFASSLDCVGVLARDVADCRLVFAALCGKDDADATSKPVSLSPEISVDPRDLRVGVVGDRASVIEAARDLERLGVRCESLALPKPEEALAAYYVLSSAEASANLARYDGVRYGHRADGTETIDQLYKRTRGEGFGDEVKRRILFGTYVLSAEEREAYYLRACAVRDRIRAAFLEEFHGNHRHAILLPTAPTTAFRIGEMQTAQEMYEADLCTVYASLAGLPAISVPLGRDENGLPNALQLIGAPETEEILFQIARMLEEVRA